MEQAKEKNFCTHAGRHCIGGAWDGGDGCGIDCAAGFREACPYLGQENRVDLVVTRHPGLVEYLRELGLATDSVEVVAHATPENVAGKRVCGVLPHSLSCLCNTFTEVPLNLPAELRGQELTLEQVRLFAGEPVTYTVRSVEMM